MLEFTQEEKRHVLLHVLENQGDCINVKNNEKMWRNIGRELNRNWMEIREAYCQWGTAQISENAALPEGARMENNIKCEPESEQAQSHEILDQEFDLVVC